MRRIAEFFGTALLLASAGPVMAEDVLIRIEARQGAVSAQQAAEGWAQEFPDVVTFPLPQGWVGIALGPMPREAAEPRLRELKTQGQIPADSFISTAEGRRFETLITPGSDSAPAPEAIAEGEQRSAGSPSLFNPDAQSALQQVPARHPPVTEQALPGDTEAATTPEPASVPEQFYIRIESSADRSRAEEALSRHLALLPEAGLWTLPNGRFAVGFGPMARDAGDAWLAAFKRTGAVPRDAFLSPVADMGEPEVSGSEPRIGTITPSGAPPPPLDEVQRALRWAGYYDGEIDGKDGPMTRAAIAREVLEQRASPDDATALEALIRRRQAWRDEIGLAEVQDIYTGLELPAPMDRLIFDRTERALSIYGPREGSGAALILFSQPGGQQDMLDLTGLVTALGWVPSPERRISRGAARLTGRNDTHISHAEAQVIDGRAQGFVLIWPASDADNQPRLAAEISDGLRRFAVGENELEFSATPTDTRSVAETAPEPTEAQAGPDTSQ